MHQPMQPRRDGRGRTLASLACTGLVVGAMAVGGAPLASGRTVSPEMRLAEILAEAETREARAAELRAEATTAHELLEAIQREVIEERRTQRNLKARQVSLGRELDDARDAEKQAARELEGLEQRLGSRLVVLYKLRAGGGLPALYEANDFQGSLRVKDAFDKILASDLALFERYQGVLAEKRAAADRKQAAFDEIEGAKAAYLQSKRKEMKREVDKKNQLDLLRRKAEREEQIARELREQAERLQETIDAAESGPPVPTGECLERGRVPRPVEGALRLRFGREVEPRYQTVVRRNGIEIVADPGQPVRAVGSGRVIFAGWFKAYGQMVIVDHGCGVLTVSGYLETVDVDVEDTVRRGAVVGTVGETGSLSGAGLYFEIRESGQAVDPEKWFASRSR